MFFLLPCDRLKMYVPGPISWFGLEPSRILLVPSPSVSAYYSGFVLCGSEADKAHLWQPAFVEFLLFSLISFIAVALSGIFMSKTTDPKIVVEGLSLLVSKLYCLARWNNDLAFFAIMSKTRLDHVAVYVAFCRGHEVNWWCMVLKDPFFRYLWGTR